MAIFPGLPGWASTRKVRPIWILLKQETVNGSSISWAVWKSGPRSRQITTPAPPTQFLQAGCPSCRPTNSAKALKAGTHTHARNLGRRSDNSKFREKQTDKVDFISSLLMQLVILAVVVCFSLDLSVSLISLHHVSLGVGSWVVTEAVCHWVCWLVEGRGVILCCDWWPWWRVRRQCG